ncbi:hypothetical protein BDN72DRAFT_965117 [Pluteus cervinus]|uniref:Uncharacterized protein n=1 Tax=Pluteus cervinus TaxID=181527 RepID=A0ACD3A775_9AGAR|nr:hypothetical protein BDN72DRAFT_965117 [Pluteus cervinus]
MVSSAYRLSLLAIFAILAVNAVPVENERAPQSHIFPIDKDERGFHHYQEDRDERGFHHYQEDRDERGFHHYQEDRDPHVYAILSDEKRVPHGYAIIIDE